MVNVTTSGSIEELKEESNLIIYIVGLILLIIWKVKVTVMCQVRLHWKHNRLENWWRASVYSDWGYGVQNRIPHLSSRSLILTVEQYG